MKVFRASPRRHEVSKEMSRRVKGRPEMLKLAPTARRKLEAGSVGEGED